MKNKYLWLVLLLCLEVFAVRMVSYDAQISSGMGLEAVGKIPHQIGGWNGTDYPLDPQIYDILETRSIIHRSYENSIGQKVFLSIVYYAETKVDFHAPESCLGGQGFKTQKSNEDVFIEKLKGKLNVSKLIQQRESAGQDLVYYFFKAGPFMGRSYFKLRLNLVLNKFRDAPRSGALIRVSTGQASSSDEFASKKILDNFLNDLMPSVTEFL